MRIVLSPNAKKDFAFWTNTGNKAVLNKIKALSDDISKHPYEGIGKPHALKHELSGLWARYINQKDRIVYEVKEDNTVEILSLKGHYSDK